MSNPQAAAREQISRQVTHWVKAAARLQDLDDLASPAAWNNLERYLGLSIRRHLASVVAQLDREAVLLQAVLGAANTPGELAGVRRQLLAFRKRYIRVETTLDYFADAINTRTQPKIGGYLRACDTLAHRSMSQLLDQLGKPTPVPLTYIDKGLGASILKAGLRLWDGTGTNPVAAIKITRHNLFRPTALIHEAGHQVAHLTGWNEELAAKYSSELNAAPPGVAETWASWTSEIAADAFAFVHAGYASVAALHDVLAGEPSFVMRYLPHDPHPICYIRVLLGVEMCRQFYGAGAWDDLALAWNQFYPLDQARGSTETLLRASRVKPETLLAMEQQLGSALYTSMHWIWTEALRLLALTGLQMATAPEKKTEPAAQPEAWMLRLGGAMEMA
jgi:hypothetical protein